MSIGNAIFILVVVAAILSVWIGNKNKNDE